MQMETEISIIKKVGRSLKYFLCVRIRSQRSGERIVASNYPGEAKHELSAALNDGTWQKNCGNKQCLSCDDHVNVANQ